MNPLLATALIYFSGYIAMYLTIKYSCIFYYHKKREIKWSLADRDEAIKYSFTSWIGALSGMITTVYYNIQDWNKKRTEKKGPRESREAKW